ncbi:MAG: 16S rRNA processing protein RimM [Acidobacteria bacterium]|nr:16S rRNA processing protein RimM [Acidobacteriota bacterium]
MPTPAPSLTVLAHLLRPQGRKGELLAELLTDFPERFTARDDLYLVPPGFEGELSTAKKVRVVSSWEPVGRNKGRIVLQFDGVESITDAESLAGFDVVIPEEERVALPEGSAYVSDLIGCAVFNREIPIGEVTGVDFPASSDGAKLDDVPSLIEVRSPDGAEILIPFVRAFLESFDLHERRIVFRLPEGLVDVNR